jgi:hypothetical protein
MNDGPLAEKERFRDSWWRRAVRVQAALASRLHVFTPAELAPHDLQAWRELRAQVSSRQESRCKHYRFRKDPAAYLADLEALLLKECLRS